MSVSDLVLYVCNTVSEPDPPHAFVKYVVSLAKKWFDQRVF